MTLEHSLRQGASQLGLVLSDQACQQLLDYLALLQKWNKVYNLSAIRDPEQMLVKHIFDSLAVVPVIGQAAPANLIDVGTGGGLPGVPLAIMFPTMPVALLDSNEKKTRFLVQVKAQLGLENVQVYHQRVEDHIQQYEAVISRAFTALDNFVNLTRPLLAPNGRWWAMKSQSLEEEKKALPPGLVVEQTYTLSVPDLNAARYLVAMYQQGDRHNG
ncbi:16S rRNA (guanine(527)-N(7))-methyltransferase RsmG [Thiomicrospira microaerophila]|uniref:16S rRNA (guanine(527)-N(7))-methyltransferase RsmG n=1 Tax=Thiomicrospira microaerophila TaxID=406020 RepID=UPI00200E0F2B|nr:16S rRNA (guanine(527)-N(7))-methyltransferase RsmG [Thiomicrospira microaerophila]UQB42164.1 16S rRNA (guanine(527)-N(7))-methyltransferase RsmG [Thiomicrospira microaerophila]